MGSEQGSWGVLGLDTGLLAHGPQPALGPQNKEGQCNPSWEEPGPQGGE